MNNYFHIWPGHIFLQLSSAKNCRFHVSNNGAFYRRNCSRSRVHAPKWTRTMLLCFYNFLYKRLAPSGATPSFCLSGLLFHLEKTISRAVQNSYVPQAQIFHISMVEHTCDSVWNWMQKRIENIQFNLSLFIKHLWQSKWHQTSNSGKEKPTGRNLDQDQAYMGEGAPADGQLGKGGGERGEDR